MEIVRLIFDPAWPFVTLVAIILAFIIALLKIQNKLTLHTPARPHWLLLLFALTVLVLAVLLFISGTVAPKSNSPWIGNLTNVLLFLATVAVALFTWRVYKARNFSLGQACSRLFKMNGTTHERS